MEHIEVISTKVEIMKGTQVGYAAEACCKLSLERRCNIETEWNGKPYRVVYNDLIACFGEDDRKDLE